MPFNPKIWDIDINDLNLINILIKKEQEEQEKQNIDQEQDFLRLPMLENLQIPPTQEKKDEKTDGVVIIDL